MQTLAALPTLRAMVADVQACADLAALDRLHADWIGYSAVQDDPAATADSLRGDLRDYIAECCYAAGVHCADAGLRD